MLRASVLSIFSIVLLAACSNDQASEDAPVPVRPAKIVLPLPVGEHATRVFPGTIESSKQSDLAFRVGGQLKTLVARPGMSFKQGDLLAELDDSEYRNTVLDRQAKYALSKSQYEKILKLREQNHVSDTTVEEAEANFKAAQAALASAEDNLRYTRLLAPFDGVVTTLNTENHQVVNAHETILSLRVEDRLDVRFNIPESLLGKLRQIKDPSSICVQVRFNAYPQTAYPACFKEFESKPDRLTRTYSVVHSMPEITEFTALPGMAVAVEVDLSNLLRNDFAQGVLVPLSAVFQEGGNEYVWRVDAEGLVSKQAVVSVGIQEEMVLVSSGLTADEAIVAVGVSQIHEGMRVRPLTKERGL